MQAEVDRLHHTGRSASSDQHSHSRHQAFHYLELPPAAVVVGAAAVAVEQLVVVEEGWLCLSSCQASSCQTAAPGGAAEIRVRGWCHPESHGLVP